MIEVRTILNPASVRKFHSHQTKSRSWIPLVFTALFYVFAFVALVARAGIPVVVMLAVIGTVIPFVYLLVAQLISRHVTEVSNEFNDERTQVWRFFDDRILFNESGKSVAAHDEKYEYDDITKVKERQDAFYLYIGSRVFMLDPKGFSVGGRKELHDYLIDRIGSRRYSFTKKIYSQK